MRLLSCIVAFLVIVVLLIPVQPVTAGSTLGTLTASQIITAPSPSPTPTGTCTVSGTALTFPSSDSPLNTTNASASVNFACTGSAKPLNILFIDGAGTGEFFYMVNGSNAAQKIPFIMCVVPSSTSTACTSSTAFVQNGASIPLGTTTSPIFLSAYTNPPGSPPSSALSTGTYTDTITIGLSF
ncbi:MAG: hypothetical protein NVSMB31_18500 [Vulcanimicrobiaceae bacterium]